MRVHGPNDNVEEHVAGDQPGEEEPDKGGVAEPAVSEVSEHFSDLVWGCACVRMQGAIRG